MNVYSLRAMTLDNKPIEFTVLDVPVIVGEDRCVLLNRKFSPILKYSTIVIGSDIGLYVGDVLKDMAGNLWYVTYNRGFMAVSKNGEMRPLSDFRRLKVERQVTQRERELYCPVTYKCKYRYRDKIFVHEDIVGKLKDKLVVSKVGQLVVPEEIQQDTDIYIDDKRIFLGDEYEGKKVLMCYGRICTQSDLGAYDIIRKEYLTKSGGI